MKKLLQGIVLTCAAVAAPVMAQTVTYACQYLETAGLNWENGRWVATGFYNKDPFILTAIDGELVPPVPSDENMSNPLSFTQCSLPKQALTGEPGEIVMSKVQSCSDGVGNTLLFNLENLSGAFSQMMGAVAGRGNASKDSLTVAPFVCETIG